MSDKVKVSIEKAWEILFDKYDVVDKINADGVFRIASSEINLVKEARLMAKFDQSSQLPDIFKKHKLSILPITRGEYLIGPFNTHTRLTYPNKKPTPVEIPNLQTLDYTNLYSEASVLLFAYNSGIIQDIMGNSRVSFTVNGRMSSGNFEYFIENSLHSGNSSKISVQNAQVEIDAGYESSDAFCICEAKNIATEELLIRQLYYPYRLWKSKISKTILPLFLVFSNDIFHVFRYEFEDMNCYNSLHLAEHKSYTFADEEISLNEVIELWKEISVKSEPDVTFPQADSFERIIDLLSVLFEGALTRDDVTLKYEFDSRQTNYYIAACEYLGLIERGTNIDGEREYHLTEDTYKIMGLRYKQKHIALIKKVLECPVFYKAFGLALSSSSIPNKNAVCHIMSKAGLSINQVTIERRSSTVRSWIDWIFRLAITD